MINKSRCRYKLDEIDPRTRKGRYNYTGICIMHGG